MAQFLPLPENGFTEELLSFAPRFYRDIKEYVEIQKVLATVVDKLYLAFEEAAADSNVVTCSENVIAFFENVIGIDYSEERTLEERRRLVLVYINIFGKLSATKIKNAISYYTGAEVDVRFTKKDEKGNHILEIECYRGTINRMFLDDIALLLKKVVPAHLLLQFSVSIKPCKDLYCGVLPQIKEDITVYGKEV